MAKKPTILVTNDDGIDAPGLQALVKAMEPFGDLYVVAPAFPQSSTGHAITVDAPLRLESVKLFDNVKAAYQCTGTPVDCVKLAVDKVLHKKPDLCVSGINHGSNSAINVIYSGTMSAAMEAAIEGIDAIGFSNLNPSKEADLSEAVKYVKKITEQVIEHSLPKGTLLNVNFPAIDNNNDPIKGIKICRQAVAKWEEEFEERIDPRERKYYWLAGKFVNYDKGEDTDEWALSQRYVAVTPVQFDLTAHHAITYINNNWET